MKTSANSSARPYVGIFAVRVDGADLVCDHTRATWFGGAHDPDDDGRTSSGVNTQAQPHYVGCSLPLDFGRRKNNPCAGSPLGAVPWFTEVIVRNLGSGGNVHCKLIDDGPSAPPKAQAGIDLTVAAFQMLGGNLKNGELQVSFRIVGAAKYLRAA